MPLHFGGWGTRTEVDRRRRRHHQWYQNTLLLFNIFLGTYHMVWKPLGKQDCQLPNPMPKQQWPSRQSNNNN